jgi:hypothetical protein
VPLSKVDLSLKTLFSAYLITIGPGLKIAAIAAPYAFLVLDVFSWWATKYTPEAAYLTMIGGFGYSSASGFMTLTSLWQMWFKKE